MPRSSSWDYCWKYEFDTEVKIENYYHHDGDQIGFYKKSTYQNTEQKALYFKERRIPWLRLIVTEQVNYTCKAEEVMVMQSEKIKAKYMKKWCVKDFFT